MSESRHTPLVLVGLLLLGVLFVAARTWHVHDSVFPEDGPVMLLGVDAYFHIRHAAYTRDHFPSHLRGDPGSHYPGIEHQEVTGLFNVGVAAGARILEMAAPPDTAIHWSAAWSPIFLGLATLIVLFLVVKRVAGSGAGLVAGLLFVLFPGYYLTKSTLGFADQHALEVLMLLMTMWGLLFTVQSASGSSGRRIGVAALTGLPFALMTISWLGYPLLLGLLGGIMVIVLLVHLATTNDPTLARSWTFTLGWGTVLMYILNTAWPQARMEVIPNVFVWVVTGMSVLTLLSGLVWWIGIRSEAARPRMLSSLVLGIVLAGSIFLFLDRHPQGRAFWFWFASTRATDVAEQQSTGWNLLLSQFLPVLIPSILAVIAVLSRKSKGAARSGWMLVVGMATATLWVWLQTRDFDYLPAVFLAASGALGWHWLHCAWASWLDRKNVNVRSRSVIQYVPLLLILGMAVTCMQQGLVRMPWTSEQEVEGLLLSDASWQEAMDWMRENTPSPNRSPLTDVPKDGPYDASSYGIMSGWDHGNFIAWRANRMPAASRYPTPLDARWLTATNETEADSLLCPGCTGAEQVRYAVVSFREPTFFYRTKMASAGRELTLQQEGAWQRDGRTIPKVTFGPAWENSMAVRMTKYHGSGLSGYRLIWESTAQRLQQIMQDSATSTVRLTSDPLAPDIEGPETGNNILTRVNDRYIYDVHVVPSVRIFEAVPGAVLIGRTFPNTEVQVSTTIGLPGSGRTYSYSRATLSDSTGAFSIRVPYRSHAASTSSSPPVAEAMESWTIETPEGRRVFRQPITETMIQTGDTLRVGDIR